MWTERKYSLLEIIIGVSLASAIAYFISRSLKTNNISSNLSLGGDISNLEHDIEKMVDDELDMAGNMMHGGVGNNSFQNIRKRINLNLGGTDGVNQSSYSNLSYN